MANGYNQVRPNRIVSLSPSCTEILFAVGAGKKVVGVTDYCNYPAELETLIEAEKAIRVGGYWNPSLETILDLKPDLVLVSVTQCAVQTNNCKITCSRKCQLIAQNANTLRSCGLNVLTLAPHSMNDVLDDVLLVGKKAGNVTKANCLVESLRQRVKNVVAKSRTVSNKLKTYFEVWNNPYMSVSSGTWIGDLIKLAGGVNIFGGSLSDWPIIESDDIIKRNPDLMVFPVIQGIPRFWGSFEAVKQRSGWDAITAIRNGSLFEIPRDLISRPGPRLVDALELLGKIIHGQPR
jgi:iron complex transport system substrate-binding protein